MSNQKLTLVVDGRAFEGSLTGIGYFSLDILRHWAATALDFEIIVIMRKSPTIQLPPTVKIIIEPIALFSKIKPVIWQRFLSPRLWKKCDLYWSPAVFLPSWGLNGGHTLSIVHDFNHRIVPETMSWGNRLAHQAWMKHDLRRADVLVANSHGTSQRCYAWLNRRPDFVIYPPVRKSLSYQNDEMRTPILKKLGIEPPYFLAVGTHEPRKNLRLLLEVFLTLKDRGHLVGFSLILAGSAGWKSSAMASLIAQSAQRGVRSLGYVDDLSLAALFSGCKAFVFPSIYEGFGMPVREARTCGASILATDSPEIREAADNEGLFIETSRKSLADALMQAANMTFDYRSPDVQVLSSFSKSVDELIDYCRNIGGKKPKGRL